jgi:hypothetical protein
MRLLKFVIRSDKVAKRWGLSEANLVNDKLIRIEVNKEVNITLKQNFLPVFTSKSCIWTKSHRRSRCCNLQNQGHPGHCRVHTRSTAHQQRSQMSLLFHLFTRHFRQSIPLWQVFLLQSRSWFGRRKILLCSKCTQLWWYFWFGQMCDFYHWQRLIQHCMINYHWAWYRV